MPHALTAAHACVGALTAGMRAFQMSERMSHDLLVGEGKRERTDLTPACVLAACVFAQAKSGDAEAAAAAEPEAIQIGACALASVGGASPNRLTRPCVPARCGAER